MTTKEKCFKMLRRFLPLLLAMGLQQLLALVVNLVDNFMLGAYTETAMSGAALVNQIQFLLMQITLGVGMGAVVLGSQYWGKGKIEPIKKVISSAFKIAIVIGLAFTIVTAVFPRQILGLLTSDSIIIEEGMQYLSVMCWTYIIFAASAVLMYSLQSVEIAYVGTIMSACTICINIALNYTFIYGNFGAKEYGIKGAAFATVCSRIVELVIVLVFIFAVDKRLKMKIKDLFDFKTGYFKDYIMVALPMIISGALWGFSQAVQTAILGHMSSEAIGANSIAVAIFQIFAVWGFAGANACSVIIGRTVGEGDIKMVKPYSKTLQIFFLLLGVVLAILLFAFKGLIIGFYNITPETYELTNTFLIVLCVTIIGTCYEYPVMAGIIAGGGDTKYEAIVDNLFMWCFVIPMSALSAFVFAWPPIVTFIFLKSDQILKCIPNAIYCNSYKFIKDRTR
ncbi:MAG: MATE family efflux transporter [Parasporobacterium sp.]|nr:MATE family efflux transporter [Parasporobacterium sp.]